MKGQEGPATTCPTGPGPGCAPRLPDRPASRRRLAGTARSGSRGRRHARRLTNPPAASIPGTRAHGLRAEGVGLGVAVAEDRQEGNEVLLLLEGQAEVTHLAVHRRHPG